MSEKMKKPETNPFSHFIIQWCKTAFSFTVWFSLVLLPLTTLFGILLGVTTVHHKHVGVDCLQ